MKTLNNEVVAVIKLPHYIPVQRIPHFADYKNPYIKEIIPCIKTADGRLISLQTGNEVKPVNEDLLWSVQVGTVFSFKDGGEFLLSRRISDQQLVWLAIEKFNPLSMVWVEVKNPSSA